MRLWRVWFTAVAVLRPACRRQRTYGWMVLVLLGLSLRLDLAGVTSFVRALGLAPGAYRRLLHVVHSPALQLERLTARWTRWCRDAFPACTVGTARICIADGLKAPKEGRQMPAVKKLHQESANNSKPPFIFGHSFQCLALLTRTAMGHAAAVPLAARLGEGVVWSNRDRRTQLDRLVLLFLSVATTLEAAVVLVADAYYASGKVLLPLLAGGHHLVTRARTNAVAYAPAPQPARRRRDRPLALRPASAVTGSARRPRGLHVGAQPGLRRDRRHDRLPLPRPALAPRGAPRPLRLGPSSNARHDHAHDDRRHDGSTRRHHPLPAGRPSGSSSAAGSGPCTAIARHRNSSSRTRSAPASRNFSLLAPPTLSSRNSSDATSSARPRPSRNARRRSRRRENAALSSSVLLHSRPLPE